MKLRQFLSVIVLSTLLTPLAFAHDVIHEVNASEPDKIVEILQKNANKFKNIQLNQNQNGDPVITFHYSPIKYTIVFYGCENHQNCTSLQFYTAFKNQKQKHTLESINQWNQNKRFIKVYLDEKQDVVLEMDTELTHKVSTVYLNEVINTWHMGVMAFLINDSK